MTLTTLAVDDRNDLRLGADGNLSTVSDLDAVMQACQHAARTLKGEKVYATDEGIPFFDVAWNGAPQLAQYEAYLRRAILSVEGVERVTSVSITHTGNTLSYSATIQTVYGAASING